MHGNRWIKWDIWNAKGHEKGNHLNKWWRRRGREGSHQLSSAAWPVEIRNHSWRKVQVSISRDRNSLTALGLLCTLWWDRRSCSYSPICSKGYQNLYMQIEWLWQLLQGRRGWLWVQQLGGDTRWILGDEEGATENTTFRTCWLCTNACLAVHWKLICFLPHVNPPLKWAFFPLLCTSQLVLWAAPSTRSLSTGSTQDVANAWSGFPLGHSLTRIELVIQTGCI